MLENLQLSTVSILSLQSIGFFERNSSNLKLPHAKSNIFTESLLEKILSTQEKQRSHPSHLFCLVAEKD